VIVDGGKVVAEDRVAALCAAPGGTRRSLESVFLGLTGRKLRDA
jgi:hypothetical protein